MSWADTIFLVAVLMVLWAFAQKDRPEDTARKYSTEGYGEAKKRRRK